LDSQELANTIAHLGLEKKAKQIVVSDLRKLGGVTDFFVIMSGDSEPQLKAIADHIIKKMREDQVRLYHKEGLQSMRWILLDYVDVVVHIFRGETREYYGLERLWGDAEMNFVVDGDV
jgi:ribosome-associated protein